MYRTIGIHIIVWTFLFLGLPKSITAQDPFFWNLTEEDGLPSMTVYDILQDDMGYIWIATANGICRYDGTEMVRIPKKGLKDADILNMVLDSEDRVWFSNLSGQLGCVENGEVRIFDEIVNGIVYDFEIIDNLIYVLLKESKDKVVISLVRFEVDSNGSLINSYKYNEKFFRVSKFCKVKSSLMWMVQFEGIDKRNIVSLQYNSDQLKKIGDGVEFDATFGIETNNKDEIYISNERNNKLYILKGAELVELIDLEKGQFNSIRNIDEQIHLLSSKGVFIVDTLVRQSDKDAILKDYNCNSIFLDSEKNSWISTTGDGILIIPNERPIVFNDENSPLENNKVQSLYDDRDRLLVGLHNAFLSSVDPIDYYVNSKKLEHTGAVSAIIQDKRLNYWFSVGNHCVVYNEDLKYKSSYQLLSKNITEDKSGNIWIATKQGCIKYIPGKHLPAKYGMRPKYYKYYNNERSYDVLEDFNGSIWLGTVRGLIYVMNDSSYQFLEKGVPTGYSVSDLNQSKDSVIWVSTLEDGLIGIKDGEVYKKYTVNDGLSSNTIRKVFCENGKIWIASDNGLNVLDRKTEKIIIVNESDGLPNNDIKDVLVKDEKVWVATMSGLATFPKNINTQNDFPPPVMINSFQIWDRDTSITENLELEHTDNNISINFSGLAYRARGNISYKYKLSGVDRDWVQTQIRTVRYPKLDPGEYLFEVFAINEDGVESELPATVSFNINIAWWNSWWFRIGIGLLTLFVIGSFVRFRWKVYKDKQRMEQEFKDKVNELRQEALQTQMNPHFIFNALNGIQQFITTNEPEIAINYLASFAGLVRMIFEQSKMKNISFDEEIEFLELYLRLENLRFKGKVFAEINIDDEVLKETYNIKIPPLLIQPIVENAFKHGLFHKKGTGNLAIDFSKENEYLVCKVSDNGVGRVAVKALNNWKSSKNHKSSGIKTSKERLEIINYPNSNNIEGLKIVDLKDDEGKASGTQVILKINCKPE